ncbi:expressed unknown protein [Seminavis robusta]|uniref:Uncharacterized protein n=1 Tax=Seminavis robusta TaxID=568900 RepID=A0A9N8ECU9_9STRA|nr:expressed unknown protein [Seminavis robusta]|eukprot:Sro815_g206510.1 n/a (296) ;mRNA; f:26564-27550
MTRLIATCFALMAALPPLASATPAEDLEFVCWGDMNPENRAAFMALGYDEEVYNGTYFYEHVPWDRLPANARAEAEAEGYDKESWHMDDEDSDLFVTRRLNALLDQQVLADILDECWFEKYTLTLFVETDKTHLDMIALPHGKNKKTCTDALTFDDFGAGIKLASLAADLELPANWEADALPLGVFPLGNIFDASDDADVVDPDEYDVVENNCATFVLQTMQTLEIPVSEELKCYVVNHLIQNVDFIDEVRKNPNVIEIVRPEDVKKPDTKLTDLQVVWRLVEYYVKNHYATPKK